MPNHWLIGFIMREVRLSGFLTEWHVEGRVYLTLLMTSAQVVEMSGNATTNCRSRDYSHTNDRSYKGKPFSL